MERCLLYIFDSETLEQIEVIEGPFSRFAWHPDSQLVATTSGGSGEGIRLWNANNGNLAQEVTWQHTEDLVRQPQVITWHPNGELIATDASHGFNELLLWEAEDGIFSDQPRSMDIATDTWHNSTYMMWNSTGEMLLSSGADDAPSDSEYATLPHSYVINTQTGEILFELPETISAWGPNGQMVISRTIVNSAKTLTIWHIGSESAVITFEEHTNTVLSVDWNVDHPIVASADISGHLFFWNPLNGYIYQEDNFTEIRDVSWKPGTQTLAIADEDIVHIQSYDFE